MKYILILLLLSGCYTRKQAVKKFCHQDTAVTIIHDTIVTDSIHADTVFHDRVDTIVLRNDKMMIRYIHHRDSIYLSGDVEADTIYRTKVVKIPVQIPNKPTVWQMIWELKWILIAIVAATFLIAKIRS